MQAGQLAIQIPEAGREPGYLIACRLESLEFLQDRVEQPTKLEHPIADFASRDSQDGLFGTIEDEGDLFFQFERQVVDGRTRPQEVTALGVFLDDARVVVDVGGARNDVEQASDIGNPADSFEFVGASQLLGDSDGVDRLVRVVQNRDRPEDRLVRRVVEVICLQLVHDIVGGLRGQEDGSENRLFGFHGVGRDSARCDLFASTIGNRGHFCLD